MELSDIVSYSVGQSLALSPIVMALVGVAKKTGLPSKFASASAVVFGVGLALALSSHWLVGILAGVAAAGFYDLGKSVSSSA